MSKSVRVPKGSISLIIPVRNRANEIMGLVDSLNCQTTSDFETIIVDDGSTDETWHHLSSLQKTPDVTLLRLKHGGPSRARNRGAAAATRDYLVFVDSDDSISLDFVHSFQLVIDSRKPQLVQAGVLIQFTNGTDGNQEMLPEPNPMSTPIRRPFLSGTYCIRSDLFWSVGGFSEHLRYAEHRELALKLCTSPKLDLDQIETIPRSLYTYMSPGEATRPYNVERTEAAEYILWKHSQCLKRAGLQLTYHRIVVTGYAKLGNVSKVISSGIGMWRTFPREASTYLTLAKALYHVLTFWTNHIRR